MAQDWYATRFGGASVPVSELQLLHCIQHGLQVALLVLQHQSGKPLQHQGHVEHQHCVAGSHMTGLKKNINIFINILGFIFTPPFADQSKLLYWNIFMFQQSRKLVWTYYRMVKCKSQSASTNNMQIHRYL